ncbi:MAG: hypothetical protein LBB09_00655 [Rickettsiales bacterium]|jgi:hypothetical protein|nr:hypothetical protein [Rickettsiales bacterium]
MFYNLAEEVFLVRGMRRSAIYDLSRQRLIRLEAEDRGRIREVLRGSPGKILAKYKKTEEFLNSNGLTEISNRKKMKSIKSLRKNFRPEFAMVEISPIGGLRCDFCYKKCDCVQEKYMTPKDFRRARDFLVANGVKTIRFAGDEPASHPDFRSIVGLCGGSFDRVEAPMDAAPSEQSWRDIFEKNNIIPIARLPSAAPGREKFADFEMFKKIIIEESNFQKPLLRELVELAVSGHQCFSRQLYIAQNLEVFPCAMERRLSHGFIGREKDSELLKRDILQFNKDSVKTCKDCEFRYACFDCRLNCEGGNIRNRPWNCSYDPRTGEWEDPLTMFKKLNKSAQ